MLLDLNYLPPRLTREQASEYLSQKHAISRTPATLAKLAHTGGGPSFRKAGRNTLYEIVELDEWCNNLLSAPLRSTSEIRAHDQGAL